MCVGRLLSSAAVCRDGVMMELCSVHSNLDALPGCICTNLALLLSLSSWLLAKHAVMKWLTAVHQGKIKVIIGACCALAG